MKRTLLVLAATAACVSGAHAQSNVRITGLTDMYVGSMKSPGDSGRTNVVNSGGMTTSWLGFQGVEDLGSGLKVDFMLNAFFRGDTGTPGRFTNDPFFSRDAFVRLNGDFGGVLLGRTMAPNFLPTILFNPFGDSFTFSPLVLHQNVSLFNASGWKNTNPSDTGWANQVVYSTPSFGGLKANLHYQFGEQAGNNSKKNIGANVLYSSGPLGLTAFYEDVSMSDPNPAVLPDGRKNWMLGGSYDFNVVKLTATYGQTKGKNDGYKGKTTSLGATIPLAANSRILAAWAQTKLDLTDAKRNTVSVGYNYDLSKRTDAYAVVMYDKVTNFGNGTSVGVGIRHRF